MPVRDCGSTFEPAAAQADEEGAATLPAYA